MDEFANRVEAQRHILHVVNNTRARGEDLYGLSAKSIDRWAAANDVSGSSETLAILREAAKKLFFLANKSQEQITADYTAVSGEIATLTQRLKVALESAA